MASNEDVIKEVRKVAATQNALMSRLQKLEDRFEDMRTRQSEPMRGTDGAVTSLQELQERFNALDNTFESLDLKLFTGLESLEGLVLEAVKLVKDIEMPIVDIPKPKPCKYDEAKLFDNFGSSFKELEKTIRTIKDSIPKPQKVEFPKTVDYTSDLNTLKEQCMRLGEDIKSHFSYMHKCINGIQIPEVPKFPEIPEPKEVVVNTTKIDTSNLAKKNQLDNLAAGLASLERAFKDVAVVPKEAKIMVSDSMPDIKDFGVKDFFQGESVTLSVVSEDGFTGLRLYTCQTKTWRNFIKRGDIYVLKLDSSSTKTMKAMTYDYQLWADKDGSHKMVNKGTFHVLLGVGDA